MSKGPIILALLTLGVIVASKKRNPRSKPYITFAREQRAAKLKAKKEVTALAQKKLREINH